MKLSIHLGFILLLNVSCAWLSSQTYDCSNNIIRGRVSDSVIVAVEPQRPRLNYLGMTNVVCRKGFPDGYILPWDEFRLNQGQGDTVNQQQDDDQEIDIRLDIGDRWFEFSPLIDNQTPFNLVITSLEMKASGFDSTPIDIPTFVGGYCEGTDFLYFLRSGEAITPVDRTRSFNKGNLRFYVAGLTSPETQEQNDPNNINFQLTQIPSFIVTWRMEGYFACDDGSQRSGFEKIDSFRVAPSTF